MAAYHSVLRLVAETEQEVGKKGISDPISMPS
jgi:hypothetical protein